MKRYFTILITLTALCVIATFIPLWRSATWFTGILPAIPLYFGFLTGVQHYLTIQSAKRDPRVFVKNFLMLTVGVLLLHLLVIILWTFTHLSTLAATKMFLLIFCIGYVIYLAFETTALVLFVKQQRKQ